MAATRRAAVVPNANSGGAAIPRRNLLGSLLAVFAGSAVLGRAGRAEAAPQGTVQAFVAEIRIFGGNFPPAGWAFCNGQILPISQNTALFSLLGTTYGGDGMSTFALPDLRGRVPIQSGQGPGLTIRNLGEAGGVEAHTLVTAEIPSHSHSGRASSANGASDSPSGRVMARDPAAVPQYGMSADVDRAAAAVAASGGDQPHNNMQPFLACNYIISLQGIYPSRS